MKEAPLIKQFVFFVKAIVIGKIKILFSSVCLEGPIMLMKVALSQLVPKYIVVCWRFDEPSEPKLLTTLRGK